MKGSRNSLSLFLGRWVTISFCLSVLLLLIRTLVTRKMGNKSEKITSRWLDMLYNLMRLKEPSCFWAGFLLSISVSFLKKFIRLVKLISI